MRESRVRKRSCAAPDVAPVEALKWRGPGPCARSRLTANAAAVRGNHHVHLVGQAGEFRGSMASCFTRNSEYTSTVRMLNGELAAAGAENYAGYRLLAASSPVEPVLKLPCGRFK